jgi:hypothetical protein
MEALMDPRHQQRRMAANEARRTLFEPLFNLRECVKHMALLEDHLNHRDKTCPDCIRKHLLTIEAYAEEGVSLDPQSAHRGALASIAEEARQWIEGFEDALPLGAIAAKVRQVRKGLTPFCVDPRRDPAKRVASVWKQRGLCPHEKATL